MVSVLALNPSAQLIDPSTLPLLSPDSVQYLGAFRLPKHSVNGDSFSYGGGGAAFRSATNSLFMSSRAGRVAEVTISAPVMAANVAQLPLASFLQPFADPMEGELSQVASSGVALSGLMIYGDRLYGTASIYYDASNSQKLSHFSHSLQLNQPSFSGWTRVWEEKKTGLVAGYMSLVPSEWQSRLGGPAVTGQCCIPIVTRTSWGPSAFSFDPSQVGAATAAASALVYYTGEYQTLGSWSGANPTYGGTAGMGGVAIIGGSRTALFVGRNGVGPYCYGNGTSNQSLHGTTSPDGSHWCYDPTSADKGQHAYPYRFQIWAYDLNDLAAVKAGQKQPWEVVPYGVWPLDLPYYESRFRIGGVTYDAERQLLYVTQQYADKVDVASHPIVHVFQLDVAPPPVPVSSVTLTADKTAPQLPATSVTFAATPADGVAPFQYKWEVSTGEMQVALAASWTESSTFVWTPSTAHTNYTVKVSVRSAWNNDYAGEATASMPFAIPAPVSSVNVTASHASPQLTNTVISFTAAPSGGIAPYSYKWAISTDGITWTPTASWSGANTLAWTPTAANANYRVAVWVRSASNNNDAGEASESLPFAINAPPPPPPPTSTSTGKVTSITVAAGQASPVQTGTATTWTASVTGGATPVQYKWMVHNGHNWIMYKQWSTENTFTYIPGIAGANKISVWARSNGSTKDEAEAFVASPSFTVVGATMVVPLPPPQTSAKVLAVFLAPDKAAPQPAGAPVTWTATAVGGTAPALYKWLVYAGAGWVPQGGWSSSPTFEWTPPSPDVRYKISVWAKSPTNTADAPEASTVFEYQISGATP